MIRIIPLLLILTSLASAQVRTYKQSLTIEFASPDDATKAQISATPVFEGKLWAFSARWDDNAPNNIPVQQAMARAGVKGTFYLNESARQFGAAYANILSKDGCDIGGHTQTHRLLHALLPNEVFYEILANRIARECDTNRPMNSFAFPGGVSSDRSDPSARKVITESLLRSGYHNTPYADFVFKNSELDPNEMSTTHQVVPGDHTVNLPKFYDAVDRVLEQRNSRIKQSYCISLGVHGRQTGAELAKLEEACKHYAGKPDWWYCTMNEYAGYVKQVRGTQIGSATGSGATRTIEITRPIAAELGSDVPLTIEVSGASVKSIQSEGFKADRVEAKDRQLFNLAHSPAHAGPMRIEAIHNGEGKVESNLKASLTSDEKQFKLSLQNAGSKRIENILVTLRLPPRFVNGVRRLAPVNLDAGQKIELTEAFGDTRPDSVYQEGRAYYVAEIDFKDDAIPSRLYATTRLDAPELPLALRDVVRMMGPITEADDVFASFAPQSIVGASLQNLKESANVQWFSGTDKDRVSIKPDRAYLFRNDAEWKKLAGALDLKPQRYLLAFDFNLPAATKVKINTGAKILNVALNGKLIDASNTIDVQTPGVNRIILQVETNDNRAVWTSYPLFLRVEAEQGTLKFEQMK